MKIWKDNKDKPKEDDELENLRKDSTEYKLLLHALNSWANSDKVMPANEFAKWLLRNKDKIDTLTAQDIIEHGLTSASMCICGHTLIEHNIFQDFSYQGAKTGPAQPEERRHCKECKCPKFQKPNM
jgi:hypothetical protein